MPLFFANAGFWCDERPHKRAGVTAQNLEIALSNSIIRVRFTQKRSFVAVQLNVRFAPIADIQRKACSSGLAITSVHFTQMGKTPRTSAAATITREAA
jgi:hypothetical protein